MQLIFTVLIVAQICAHSAAINECNLYFGVGVLWIRFLDTTSQFIDRRRAAMDTDWSALNVLMQEQRNVSTVASALESWLEERYDGRNATVLGGELLIFYQFD
jgi:hypothetical protein